MAKKEFDNTNRGVLFINNKDGNDARPDKKGHVFIKPDDFTPGPDGLVKIELSGWVKETENAGEIISLKASPPYQK